FPTRGAPRARPSGVPGPAAAPGELTNGDASKPRTPGCPAHRRRPTRPSPVVTPRAAGVVAGPRDSDDRLRRRVRSTSGPRRSPSSAALPARGGSADCRRGHGGSCRHGRGALRGRRREMARAMATSLRLRQFRREAPCDLAWSLARDGGGSVGAMGVLEGLRDTCPALALHTDAPALAAAGLDAMRPSRGRPEFARLDTRPIAVAEPA